MFRIYGLGFQCLGFWCLGFRFRVVGIHLRQQMVVPREVCMLKRVILAG